MPRLRRAPGTVRARPEHSPFCRSPPLSTLTARFGASCYERLMPTFDVACKLDRHEVSNAVNQASRELGQRYDFKGTDASCELNEEGIALRAKGEGRVRAALEVLRGKLAKRGVSMMSIDPQTIQPAGGENFRQLIKLVEGIDKDDAKKIVKTIKDSKLKVQASIQGDVVRVSGKKRDDLQEVIAHLKASDLALPLSYTNFRD